MSTWQNGLRQRLIGYPYLATLSIYGNLITAWGTPADEILQVWAGRMSTSFHKIILHFIGMVMTL